MRRFSLDPNVQRDLAEFLTELQKWKPRYVVVGGWAVMAHSGKLRVTKDLDVYVAPDDENLLRVARALGAFGAPAKICSVDALRANPEDKFAGVTFGVPPNRLDILSKMEIAFDDIDARAVRFDMAGEGIPVASVKDLIALKQRALADDPSRKTDRLDLKTLEALEPRPRRK